MVHAFGGHHHVALQTTTLHAGEMPDDSHMHEMFDHIDTSGNGYISKDEAAIAIGQMEDHEQPVCMQAVVNEAFEGVADPESGATYTEFISIFPKVNEKCHPDHP